MRVAMNSSSNSTKKEAELVKCWKFPFSCLTLKSDRPNKEQLSKALLEGLGFKWFLFSRIIISPLDQLGSVYSMLSEFLSKECTSLDQIQVFGILKVGECLHRIRSSLHGTVPLEVIIASLKTLYLMEEIKSFESQQMMSTFQHSASRDDETKSTILHSQQLNEECLVKEQSDNMKILEMLDKGCMKYGCPHYRRRCRIKAPCCDEVFDCRHCHNDAKNNINVNQKLRHDMPRHEVRQVICSLCGTEQEVRQFCINCGVCMGRYFCETCKLFDDDTSKKQYHCDGCGICRIGGRENFFHCYKCGCCYSNFLKNSHPCVEGAMHHDCPVCFEFLFESRYNVTVLPCGHTIHEKCLKEMREHCQYACPLCSKSVCDMSKVWEKFDMEIAATPMPEPYQNKMVWILCNDCGKTTQVQYHIVAQKCLNCKSYNTRQTRG